MVRRAVPKRQEEFFTARELARRALARLAFRDQPIPSGPRGEPCWPLGVTGSITHCTGYRGCAVARRSDLCSLGIDAEPNQPLPPDVLDEVAPHGAERSMLERLAAASPDVSWDRLLFSAKEAVYKAWYPLTGLWLGFEDAIVRFDLARRAFTADLLVPGPRLPTGTLSRFDGHWAASNGLVMTGVAVPAGDGSSCATRAGGR